MLWLELLLRPIFQKKKERYIKILNSFPASSVCLESEKGNVKTHFSSLFPFTLPFYAITSHLQGATVNFMVM